MTEAVQLALIDKIPSLAAAGASVIAAIGAATGGYFSYRTHAVSKLTMQVAQKTEENTNHLKDELVAAVSKERFAAGQKQEAADTSAANALFLARDPKGGT